MNTAAVERVVIGCIVRRQLKVLEHVQLECVVVVVAALLEKVALHLFSGHVGLLDDAVFVEWLLVLQ